MGTIRSEREGEDGEKFLLEIFPKAAVNYYIVVKMWLTVDVHCIKRGHSSVVPANVLQVHVSFSAALFAINLPGNELQRVSAVHSLFYGCILLLHKTTCDFRFIELKSDAIDVHVRGLGVSNNDNEVPVFTHLIGSCEIFSGHDQPELVWMHLMSLCHVSRLIWTCLVNLITLRWYITSWPFHTQATDKGFTQS